jgi:hypothetical protein
MCKNGLEPNSAAEFNAESTMGAVIKWLPGLIGPRLLVGGEGRNTGEEKVRTSILINHADHALICFGVAMRIKLVRAVCQKATE